MLYLTKYTLSHKDCLRLRIKDTYSLHRSVLDLFPRQEGEGRVLFADKGFRRGERAILILSGRSPEAPGSGGIIIRQIPPSFLEFSVYNFEVVLNPVKRCADTGKRTPMRNREEITEWFQARSLAWGFNTLSLEIHEIWADNFKKNGNMVTLGKASLRGALEVLDPEKFKAAVASGLGHGKAFGCGLLQLRPLF